jgi:hypothetical protein
VLTLNPDRAGANPDRNPDTVPARVPVVQPGHVRILWTADRSGVAHAHVSGRTLCHAQAIAERDAWPTLTRCPACLAAIAKGGR